MPPRPLFKPSSPHANSPFVDFVGLAAYRQLGGGGLGDQAGLTGWWHAVLSRLETSIMLLRR